MTKPNFLSATLIAAAMLSTPAMARESHVTSRHLALDANASIAAGARVILTGASAVGLRPWAHLPQRPGIKVPLANPRGVFDPSVS